MAITRKVVAGQPIASTDFRQYFGDHFSSFVKTGFEVTEGTGVIVDISAGTAYIKDATDGMYQVVSTGTETQTLTDDATNYVFLHSDNGATYITDSTSATVPNDAILLATVVCASGDVTSVVDEREMLPIVQQEHIMHNYRESLTTTTGRTTVSLIKSINLFADRVITLRKVKYTYAKTSTTSDTFTVSYSLNGTDYTSLWTITQSGAISATTRTDTINATSASASATVYVKFEITTTTGSGPSRTFSDFYISYLTSP